MRYLAAAVLLVTACSPRPPTRERMVNAYGQALWTDDVRAGTGQECAVSTDCIAGLVCQPLLWGSPSRCAFEAAVADNCPSGFSYAITAQTYVGATIGLGLDDGGMATTTYNVTGAWCVPDCLSFADCFNSQCCYLPNNGASVGMCYSPNDAGSPVVPVSCP